MKPLDPAFAAQVAKLARKARLLVPSTSGDVRAEVEELRDGLDVLEKLCGSSAHVRAIGSGKKGGER